MHLCTYWRAWRGTSCKVEEVYLLFQILDSGRVWHSSIGTLVNKFHSNSGAEVASNYDGATAALAYDHRPAEIQVIKGNKFIIAECFLFVFAPNQPKKKTKIFEKLL